MWHSSVIFFEGYAILHVQLGAKIFFNINEVLKKFRVRKRYLHILWHFLFSQPCRKRMRDTVYQGPAWKVQTSGRPYCSFQERLLSKKVQQNNGENFQSVLQFANTAHQLIWHNIFSSFLCTNVYFVSGCMNDGKKEKYMNWERSRLDKLYRYQVAGNTTFLYDQ